MNASEMRTETTKAITTRTTTTIATITTIATTTITTKLEIISHGTTAAITSPLEIIITTEQTPVILQRTATPLRRRDLVAMDAMSTGTERTNAHKERTSTLTASGASKNIHLANTPRPAQSPP